MALIICKECRKEISDQAEACVNCGCPIKEMEIPQVPQSQNVTTTTKKPNGCLLTFLVGSLIFVIMFIILVNALSSLGNNKSKPTSNIGKEQNQQEQEQKQEETEPLIYVGTMAITDKFEITVLSVEQKTSVGSQYFNSTPASGGIYVAVKYEYKNISNKPIGAFSTPKISLVDGNGVKYSADISASAYYATEIEPDRKVLSDLNPGIKVLDGKIFEVSKDSYRKNSGWTLQVDADAKYTVNIN